jgi:hypothetical protein
MAFIQKNSNLERLDPIPHTLNLKLFQHKKIFYIASEVIMKTKQFFLALPFCLGVVLTFMLAACPGGSDSPSDGESSSSANVPVSSAVIDTTGNIVITVEPNVDLADAEVRLRGQVDAGNLHIVSLRFIPDGWVKYNGAIMSSEQTWAENDGPTNITLTSRTVIDLKQGNIPCGGISVSVEACTILENGQRVSPQTPVFFTKPQSYCNSSSSVEQSSSSEAVWKFGTLNSFEVLQSGTSKTGTGTIGSIDITLDENDGLKINLTNGKIQWLGGINDFEPTTADTYPVVGKAYPDSKFKDKESFATVLDIVNKDYYFVYSNDNSNKYLMRCEASSYTWPKTVKYWPVTESP